MSRAITLHAGFHKTGTTSAQAVLRASRAALRPHLRVVLRPAMRALCEAARAYSVSRGAADLALVRFEAAELAARWDDRAVLLSSEDLCGHMPGRRGLTDYGAAPRLLAAITEAFAACHPRARQRVILTTRAPGPWLRSCYVQHLRKTAITQSAADYARAFAGSADLDGIARAAARVAAAEVETLALETIGGARLGPAEALLGRAAPGMDLSDLAPLPPANTAPSQATLDAMRAVNRAGLPETARRAQIDTLLGRAR